MKKSNFFTSTIVLSILLACIMLVGTARSVQADEQHPRVKLQTTHGEIVLELDSQAAPLTVANFLSYVKSGFYDKTIFHRVIKNFMIQGGGLTADLQPKSTRDQIPNEADNGLKNLRGTIAMARTNHPHSATAQFFINTKDNPFLDHKGKNMQGYGYCVFGKVISGMDTVERIEKQATQTVNGRGDVPVTPVTIDKAILLPAAVQK